MFFASAHRLSLVVLALCLVLLAQPAHAANTHGAPNVYSESAAWFGDLDIQHPILISGCAPSMPSGGLTLSAFACAGYARDPAARPIYISQPAQALTLPNTTGTWWLAVHAATHSGVTIWSRLEGTHYLYAQSTTQPGDPPSGFVFASASVSGAAITAVNTAPYIQARITEAPDGATVTVPAGTWTIGTTGLLIDSKTRLTLQCAPGATFLVNGLPTQTVGSFGATSVKVTGCTRCVIEGCTFDGNGEHTITAQTVGIMNSSFVKFRSNEVLHGQKLGGLVTVGNTYNEYTDNEIHDTNDVTARGMWIGSNPTGELESDCLIARNHVYKTATGIGGMRHRCRVTENHTHHTTGSGINYGSGSVAQTQEEVISNNITHDNSFFGIQSDGILPGRTIGVVVTGNYVTRNTSGGIYVVHAIRTTITGNIVNSNGADGGSTTAVGIDLQDCQDCIVSSNDCSEARSTETKGQYFGIRWQDADPSDPNQNYIIVANNCNGNKQGGIRITDNGGTLGSVIVANNLTNINGGLGGISIVPSIATTIANVVVSGNIALANTNVDLRVGTSLEDNLPRPLQIYGNIFGAFVGASPTSLLTTTTVPPRHLSGTAAMGNGAATAAVAFAAGQYELDANYRVLASCDVDHGGVWPTAVTTTGFTLNRKTSAGATICTWLLFR